MNEPAYGLWPLVILNAAIFMVFAYSFSRPKDKRDWHSLGTFSAFLLALFTEMYGFPLTLYLLSGWLQSRYPGLDLLTHNGGHLWQTLLGWKGDPHLSLLHLLSNLVIAAGMILIGRAWRVLHQARRQGTLASSGPYAYVRHPQYLGFIGIMAGFLLQWPTLLTLLMFPVLVARYLRLARSEEREVAQTFGETYQRYATLVPAFIPWSKPTRPLSGKT
ncbi:MAG: isoprenylcysteine carboxylmethyltransferase family protein [Thermaceae bacterium]|nr:isoprenylcysteine carboxylmethyltransferase family protein [Thermaceae bacterium]